MSGPQTVGSVFISYRRGGGAEIARVVEAFLDAQGFDVFLDVDSLGGGHFDEQILREIEAREVFILICSSGCFERCIDPSDWVRRELECALLLGKHLVPVTLRGFEWPGPLQLPDSIRNVARHNAFEYSHNHWKQTRGKLLDLIRTYASGTNRSSETNRVQSVHERIRRSLGEDERRASGRARGQAAFPFGVHEAERPDSEIHGIARPPTAWWLRLNWTAQSRHLWRATNQALEWLVKPRSSLWQMVLILLAGMAFGFAVLLMIWFIAR